MWFLLAALLAGPCACGPGVFCSWSDPDFSGSHVEYPSPGTHVARSLLNRSLDPVLVSGTVAGGPRTYCLNPGDSVEDTGAPYTITQVVTRTADC